MPPRILECWFTELKSVQEVFTSGTWGDKFILMAILCLGVACLILEALWLKSNRKIKYLERQKKQMTITQDDERKENIP